VFGRAPFGAPPGVAAVARARKCRTTSRAAREDSKDRGPAVRDIDIGIGFLSAFTNISDMYSPSCHNGDRTV